MATAEKLGGNWVIVRNDATTVDEADGSTSTADDDTIRLFWTGDRWSAQYGLAKQFLSKKDAEAYLALHFDCIG
jgi:hypothetical protein